MKLEKSVVDKVTKTEKVLTIAESEYNEIVESVMKELIADRVQANLGPIIDLALLMETASFAGKLHRALFDTKED